VALCGGLGGEGMMFSPSPIFSPSLLFSVRDCIAFLARQAPLRLPTAVRFSLEKAKAKEDTEEISLLS